ncbi:MAG: phosphoribosylamine--glycine ligase [Candidatus Omnitrophica bacterium]|nr:phosphoribosylamine--glycine ligase [Candidatus Omnitrophota bacterium]
MKVLVVGSGGREHALIWKIAQSRRVDKIYAAPGNGGIASLATLVDIKADDISGLSDFASREKIGLTVVGPEMALVKGIADEFEKRNLRIFGAKKSAALLEGSKIFAKETMREFDVPTADFKVFDKKEEALSYVKKKGAPIVIKADGLAAGKGVFVCSSLKEAEDAIDETMGKKVFGSSGDRVVIEECLEGEEASVIVVSDGESVVPMASSQDHKRIYDDDKGANTGGMGAYSPAPVVEGEIFQETLDRIIYPVINGLKKKGVLYKGVLYAGIMITKDGPYVLEFNVRFGDPETQAILPRMKGDLIDLIECSIDGKLRDVENEWDKRACVCVVAASGGYPGEYEKGRTITGLKGFEETSRDVVIFHAATKKKNSDYVTSGGRVLGVTALGEDIKGAVKKSYEAIGKIHFDNMHYRKDIGKRALN